MALEDVDDENGCIHYVKGSHKHEYRPHGRSEILGFSQGVTDFGTEEDKTKILIQQTTQKLTSCRGFFNARGNILAGLKQKRKKKK